MKKLVRFNGYDGKHICCDEPTLLEVGKIYEVLIETNLGWQQNYHLKEVKGEYDSRWFSKVDEETQKET